MNHNVCLEEHAVIHQVCISCFSVEKHNKFIKTYL